MFGFIVEIYIHYKITIKSVYKQLLIISEYPR